MGGLCFMEVYQRLPDHAGHRRFAEHLAEGRAVATVVGTLHSCIITLTETA